MTLATRDEFYFDPFSAEVVANADAWYRRLRDEYPVYYNPDYDTFFFSRFEDVWNVLRIGKNALLATETNLPTPDYLRGKHNHEAPPLASINPMAPGPQLHSPWYEAMHQAHIGPLRPKAVQELQQFTRDLARERLDELLPRGEFDLTSEYTAIVPARVICHLFGLPLTVADEVIASVNDIGRNKTGKSGIDLTAFFSGLQKYIVPAIQARRDAGADGSNALVDGLINYRQGPEARALGDAEIADQLVCAMVGGLESVPKVSGGGILELWRQPEQMAAVREDLDGNIPVAAEEMIRYCAPAQYTFRTAHRDIVVAGQQVCAGQRVACMLYSAARDEREFPDPDAFVWNRSIPRVISFGGGQHHCIGKYLAIMEVRTLVHEFLSRVSEFEFDLSGAGGNVGYFQRGWLSLPVRIRD